jgi:membrane associated rhomboid family serine protease
VARFPGSSPGVQFGPGPITPAVRAIIIANVAMFLVTFIWPRPIIDWLGLTPADVLDKGRAWQLTTYLFIHSPAGLGHILFNMLLVWMFGVDLERRWGTTGFAKYYFVTGIGAGVCSLLVSLLPYSWAKSSYYLPTVGASGAVYGLLMAWALLFPHRQILFMFIFPLSARMFVLIIGAIAFFSTIGASGNGVANVAHLGGLLVGWLALKSPRDIRLELQYRLSRWRMERMRRKFNVHKGGKGDDWTRRIH